MSESREQCTFYSKIGACKYGDQCGRAHTKPASSKVIMIPNMHQDPLLVPIGGIEENGDSLDAPDDDELQRRFVEFFEDAHPEFQKAGKVVQFKVCRNMVPHLRGNVYVQYDTEEEAAKALAIFDGRYFGGRRLACEFVPVTSWRTAICGVSDRRRCPKGDGCNFLHVFSNPNNLYREADFDFEPPPKKSHRFGELHDRDRERDRGMRDRERIRHDDSHFARAEHRDKREERPPHGLFEDRFSDRRPDEKHFGDRRGPRDDDRYDRRDHTASNTFNASRDGRQERHTMRDHRHSNPRLPYNEDAMAYNHDQSLQRLAREDTHSERRSDVRSFNNRGDNFNNSKFESDGRSSNHVRNKQWANDDENVRKVKKRVSRRSHSDSEPDGSDSDSHGSDVSGYGKSVNISDDSRRKKMKSKKRKV